MEKRLSMTSRLKMNQDTKFNKSADEMNLKEEDDDIDNDAETAAELGEGIYMRSGDAIVLREFSVVEGEENNTTYLVANGGGFAVLQEQDIRMILEKARQCKRNRLIKSGDSVMFKMIQKKGDVTETRYLMIHRGGCTLIQYFFAVCGSVGSNRWIQTIERIGKFTIFKQSVQGDRLAKKKSHRSNKDVGTLQYCSPKRHGSINWSIQKCKMAVDVTVAIAVMVVGNEYSRFTIFQPLLLHLMS